MSNCNKHYTNALQDKFTMCYQTKGMYAYENNFFMK